MATIELQLQRSCMLYASSLGILCYHFQAAKYQLPNAQHVDSGVPVGWPDLTLIYPNGTVAFVELKIHPNKPSKKQLHYLSILPNAHLCYSFNEFKEIVNEIL